MEVTNCDTHVRVSSHADRAGHLEIDYIDRVVFLAWINCLAGLAKRAVRGWASGNVNNDATRQ